MNGDCSINTTTLIAESKNNSQLEDTLLVYRMHIYLICHVMKYSKIEKTVPEDNTKETKLQGGGSRGGAGGRKRTHDIGVFQRWKRRRIPSRHEHHIK